MNACPTTRLTATRLHGIETGKFPFSFFSRVGDTVTFKLAMERTVRIQLGKMIWMETSPREKFEGKISPEGIALILRRLEKI